ncbi:jg3439 [Pararge aegeria aegeria]|uniref:Jg3439 protein n=1 Tax=Pararge aegeria aegeria TaxID=348720 RepID=A0A8S4RQW8_9NEOP|nr:jg3439 [Pararge aegeria aegeria]
MYTLSYYRRNCLAGFVAYMSYHGLRGQYITQQKLSTTQNNNKRDGAHIKSLSVGSMRILSSRAEVLDCTPAPGAYDRGGNFAAPPRSAGRGV